MPGFDCLRRAPRRQSLKRSIVAKTQTLSKLFQALSSRDVEGAAQIAAQIVGDEEKKGHRDAARQLRGALSPNSLTNGAHINAQSRYHGLLSQSLVPQTGLTKLADLSLPASLRRELEIVVREWQRKLELSKAGIRPRSRLLFHGPPGCGKSATAKALGNEIGLPTFLVRFDAVIGAYLGQTAIHLRELFRFAEQNACVLIFDEVDALGKRRGNPLDVGELDRIVIAFMQELEHAAPTGLVIATSNLADDLDRALWRRFDLAVEFPKPSKSELAAFVAKRALHHGLTVPKAIASKATRAASYAESERIVEGAVRERILNGHHHKNGARDSKR